MQEGEGKRNNSPSLDPHQKNRTNTRTLVLPQLQK